MTIQSLILTCTLLVACGVPQHSSDLKIVGGVAASRDHATAKSTVALIRTSDRSMFCSGTLIARNIVLTAAHCLKDMSDSFAVGFGLKDSNAKLIAVKKSSIHERYNESNMDVSNPESPANDIATITLASNAPSEYPAVKLAVQGTPLEKGDSVILAGFGVSQMPAAQGAGALRYTQSEVFEIHDKAREFIYSSGAGKGGCMGDSGGPVYQKNGGALMLLGVHSRGSADCNGSGTVTDLRYFAPWITAHTR